MYQRKEIPFQTSRLSSFLQISRARDKVFKLNTDYRCIGGQSESLYIKFLLSKTCTYCLSKFISLFGHLNSHTKNLADPCKMGNLKMNNYQVFASTYTVFRFRGQILITYYFTYYISQKEEHYFYVFQIPQSIYLYAIFKHLKIQLLFVLK